MIELKKVSKVYQSKASTSTQALQDVSFQLENKGMTFILGKSGSGKSTLLHLLGGLDQLTSGEILVANTSMNDFSKQEWDSYRNTYVGFVFQEFHVLESYNVYENIELSLGLQRKAISHQETDQLLEKLGIGGLGERRMNELSGGQIQRVAIARALIKNPKIILADEPTGNLDTHNGEQIFKLLKEISKDRLVVVVTHDREAATTYGDRIIELENGKVIEDTHPQIENKTSPKPSFQKSHLPFLFTLKLSWNNLKRKPIRLMMTVFCMMICVILTGLSLSFLLFSKEELYARTMRENHNFVYSIQKWDNINHRYVPLEEKDFSKLQQLSDTKWNVAYSLYNEGTDLAFVFGAPKDSSDRYYQQPFPTPVFIEVEDDQILTPIVGRLPENDREIVVHRYFVEYASKLGVKTSSGELYYPKDIEDLLKTDVELKLGENAVRVVGVIDDDNAIFQEAYEKGIFQIGILLDDDLELYEFFERTYRAHAARIYVKGFTKTSILKDNPLSYLDTIQNQTVLKGGLKTLNSPMTVMTKDGKKEISELKEKEIIVSYDTFVSRSYSYYEEFVQYMETHQKESSYEKMKEQFIQVYLQEHPSQISLTFYQGYGNRREAKNETFTIVGVSLEEDNYISNTYVENYHPELKLIDSVYGYDDDLTHVQKTFQKIPSQTIVESGELTSAQLFSYHTDYTDEIEEISNQMKQAAPFIYLMSVISLLFTFLFLTNFIGLSILQSHKDIGILMALGTSHRDILKIFGYESFMTSFLSWCLGIIGWIAVSQIVNRFVFGTYLFQLHALSHPPVLALFLLVFMVMIVFSITVIALRRVSIIKPMDAILNK